MSNFRGFIGGFSGGGEAGTSFSIKISYFLTQKDGNMKFRWVCMVIDYSMDEKTKFIPNSS